VGQQALTAAAAAVVAYSLDKKNTLYGSRRMRRRIIDSLMMYLLRFTC